MWSCKKNLKHFKFWKYFYWKHDKATLSVRITNDFSYRPYPTQKIILPFHFPV